MCASHISKVTSFLLKCIEMYCQFHLFEDLSAIYRRSLGSVMQNLYLLGDPEKMSFSEKGAYLTKGHFFWDTWYINKGTVRLSVLVK